MTFLAAILPVIFTVGLGWYLVHRNVVPRPTWAGLETLTYIILFPALIINALWTMDLSAIPTELMLILITAQAFMGLLAWGAGKTGTIAYSQRGVIIQSNVRFNTFVGLSIIAGALGPEALKLGAFGVAAMVPVSNVVAVTALVKYAPNQIADTRRVFYGLVTNPLIIAIAIGLALSGLGLPAVGPVAQTFSLLGQAAIGCGLLAAGAAIDFKALGRARRFTLAWAFVRLLTLPLVTLLVGLMLGLSGHLLTIAVILAATPTASSGVVLARKLGNDAGLAANLVAVQTVFSTVTIPSMFWLTQLAMGV